MSVRRAPYWLDRFPRTRRPAHSRITGEHTTRVVIVGGGLTGCACAWSFAAAGVPVVVLEADRLGAGATAGSLGLVREDFDASFQTTAASHGLRAARALWRQLRRASLDFSAAVRRLDLRCDHAPLDLLHLANRLPQESARLRREYQARRAAGLEHTWITPAAVTRQTSVESGGAIRTRGAGLDPYRACLGFASAAAGRGAVVYERSPVRRIRFTRRHVDVLTAAATVRAEAVVVTTAAASPGVRALHRHLRPEQGYAVLTESLPAAVRRELGNRAAALRDAAAPPHFLRWLKDDRVLFAGADQRPVASRALDKVLIQRTGQLMYELSTMYPAISGAEPEWSWAYTYEGTVDGLPFIGTHRNFPHHLFALGQGRHGAAVSWLAARLLLRQFLGEAAKGDELFGFGRIL
ncbi:MAG TPA: FAD-dependent oxidoreductase [Vicinamibacterales bacterium]|nr:FAD-dependent oxidoreductase [Vicinamibacterales bacterium]